MKYLLVLLIVCPLFIAAQEMEEVVEKEDIIRDIYFLASDELEGRKTGEQGSLVAARYIAESFRENGLISPEGVDDYYQYIPFEKRIPTKKGSITTRDTTLNHGEDLLILAGEEINNTAEMVFVDQGWVSETEDQYHGKDVEGKIVLALFGVPGSQDPREGFSAIRKKREFASKRGAVGIIEIYTGGYPWQVLKGFLLREQISLGTNEPDEIDIFYGLANYKFTPEIAKLNSDESVEVVIESSGVVTEKIKSPNVIGWLEGSDPALKDEYIILSAHYDHVGTKEVENGEDGVFNGARDNAIGLSSILQSADYFSENKPKRSMLFIAFAGEEIGLLGSTYYADNPVLPLKNAIFNLNTDGAGYNDTTRITVIGLDRVGVLDIFNSSASAVGLAAMPDPAPEQGLFDRSDNVSFAKKGIPAPTFAGGMTAFDQEINKYYHKVEDNPQSLNFNYLHKFISAYILTAKAIADLDQRPVWKIGDKYEEAYNNLINKP
jgi:hypothetical protein